MVLASFAYANRNRIITSNLHVYICLQTTDIGLPMVITCLHTKNYVSSSVAYFEAVQNCFVVDDDVVFISLFVRKKEVTYGKILESILRGKKDFLDLLFVLFFFSC